MSYTGLSLRRHTIQRRSSNGIRNCARYVYSYRTAPWHRRWMQRRRFCLPSSGRVGRSLSICTHRPLRREQAERHRSRLFLCQGGLARSRHPFLATSLSLIALFRPLPSCVAAWSRDDRETRREILLTLRGRRFLEHYLHLHGSLGLAETAGLGPCPITVDDLEPVVETLPGPAWSTW